MSLPEPLRDNAAACDFLAMVAEDRAVGHARTLADYLLRFPGFEARITREWAALVPASDGDGAAALPYRQLGRYRLLRALGRGGQAAVYLAHDPEQDRVVALKVLDGDATWSSQARRQRLQREAEALARLDHPAVCAIHEARLDGMPPFLVMRYVPGETLAARLQRARQQPEPHALRLLAGRPDDSAAIVRVLAMGEDLARALHAAHETGVVHRDVKPQNVMLDDGDRPVLLDFGIARCEDADGATLTRSGELFGSVAYMPPERLAGRGDRDVRGDVYGLGVVLYECLTLERPFDAPTAEAMLRAIETGAPRDPRTLNPAIGADLALVLATALESDVARRYGSALALADDLRRLQRGETVAARPAGAVRRLRRFAQRHPALAATTALLLVGFALMSFLLVTMAAQRRRLAAWQEVVDALGSEAAPGVALQRVLDVAAHVPEGKLNGPLLELLGRSNQVLDLDERRFGVPISGNAFYAADDRELVLLAGGEVVAVDAASGAVNRRLPVADAGGGELCARSDGREFVTTSRAGVRRWDASTWAELPLPAPARTWGADPTGAAARATLADDGTRLAVASARDGLLVCELAAPSRAWRVPGIDGDVRQVAFQPGGDQIVVRIGRLGAAGAHDVRVLGAGGAGAVTRLDVDGQETSFCAFDAAGSRLVMVGYDAHVRVFDAASWRVASHLQALGDEYDHVYWAGFVGDDRLVTMGFEGLTVWDLARGARVVRHPAPSGRPLCAGAWSPDRTQLAAVAKDGTIHVFATGNWVDRVWARWTRRAPEVVGWNRAGDHLVFQDELGIHVCASVAPVPTCACHTDAVVWVEYAVDGTLVTASRDGSATIVDVGRGRPGMVFVHPAPVRRARWSADATRVLTACDDGMARLWPRAGGPPVLLAGHAGAVIDAVFVDDSRVLTIGGDGAVLMFDAASGRRLLSLTPHASSCLSVAVDRELGLVATGGADCRVHVHDLQGALLADLDTVEPGRLRNLFSGHAAAVAFDRARRRLLVANRCDDLLAFALDGWRPTRIGAGSLSMQLAVASDAGSYATAQAGVGDWALIDADSLAVSDLGRGSYPDAPAAALRFSPDGRLLLVAARDGMLSLWNVVARERHLELRTRHAGVRAAAFSQDGEWIATGNHDGSVQVWPVHPIALARQHHARLTGK